MLPHVVAAELANDYRIHLTFSDGVSGVVDFKEQVLGRGGMFSALEEPSVFNAFTIDAESGTLVWPNGVDFCPVTLHALVTGRGAVAP
jgi:hypothetical protein